MKAERLHIEIEIDDREFKGRAWDDAPLDIEAFLQKEPSPLTQPQLLEIALSVEPSGKVMLIPSRGFPKDVQVSGDQIRIGDCVLRFRLAES